MAKRGRPKKTSSFLTKRWLYALFEFDQAKSAGQKHSAALDTVVAEMLIKHPRLKISQREIKRMLAKWRAPNIRRTFLCRELSPDEGRFVIPDGTVLKFSLQVNAGPRPNYPRYNARPKIDTN